MLNECMKIMFVRLYHPTDREGILKNIPSSRPNVRENQLQMAACNMYSCFVSLDESLDFGINGLALVRDLGDDTSFYLEQITVKKDERRKGIGTGLMKGVFEDLGPGKRMSLCVNTDNDVAIKFYESLGFNRTGFTKGYRKGQDKHWYAIDF